MCKYVLVVMYRYVVVEIMKFAKIQVPTVAATILYSTTNAVTVLPGRMFKEFDEKRVAFT